MIFAGSSAEVSCAVAVKAGRQGPRRMRSDGVLLVDLPRGD